MRWDQLIKFIERATWFSNKKYVENQNVSCTKIFRLEGTEQTTNKKLLDPVHNSSTRCSWNWKRKNADLNLCLVVFTDNNMHMHLYGKHIHIYYTNKLNIQRRKKCSLTLNIWMRLKQVSRASPRCTTHWNHGIRDPFRMLRTKSRQIYKTINNGEENCKKDMIPT
jgi:hypothetical protein